MPPKNSANLKSNTVSILLFLMMIIGGVIIAYSADGTNEMQRYSFVILISLGCGFGASFLTGKITGQGTFGFLNIKSATGGFLVWLIALSTFLYFFPKTSDASARPVSTDKKTQKLRICVLKSGNYEYSNTILLSFLDVLRDSLKQTKYDLETPTILTGLGDTYNDPQIMADFKDKVQNMLSRGKFDYYLTIGSAASKAFADYKRDNGVNVNFIFMGVTDPVSLDLCNSISSGRLDPEHEKIGGVAYCGNYEELPNRVHRLFPNDKICYLYNANIIEDEHLAKRFQNEVAASLIEKGILSIKRLDRSPVLGDFSDSNTVYFSWSTFDDSFINNFKLVSHVKRIISTTSSHAEYGLVPIAVTTSDEFIGQSGANIVLENLMKNMPLEKIDIVIPPWKSFVNVRLASKRNIPDSVIDQCEEKF